MRGITKNKERQNLYKMIEESEQLVKFQTTLLEADISSQGLSYQKMRKLVVCLIESGIQVSVLKRFIETDPEYAKNIYHNCMEEDAAEMDPINDATVTALLAEIQGIEDLLSTEKELDTIKKDMKASTKQYIDEISSEGHEQERLDRLDRWKRTLELGKNDMDPLLKRELVKNIRIESSRFTLDFLFERLMSEKTREKEKLSAIDSFFQETKSRYVIQRYKDKAVQAGFDASIYQLFANLEEKYLVEEYHMYNNFFLFYCQRYIAYCNIHDNYMEVQCIISNLNNLFYDRFVSDEHKRVFLSRIYFLLDFFLEERERFERENITYKNHPNRIAKEEERKRKQRSAIYRHLNELGVLTEITKELEDMSLEELITYSKEQDARYKERHALVEEIMTLSLQIPDKEQEMVDLDAMSIEELQNYKLYLLEPFHKEVIDETTTNEGDKK